MTNLSFLELKSSRLDFLEMSNRTSSNPFPEKKMNDLEKKMKELEEKEHSLSPLEPSPLLPGFSLS